MSPFRCRVDDQLSVALVERAQADVLQRLWRQNADRLRRWEPWAAKDPEFAGAAAWIDYCLRRFGEGSYLYVMLLSHGEPVGTCGLDIDVPSGAASLGYFVDRQHEGRGLVTRAGAWMTQQAFERGVHRVSIQAAAGNQRSRAVAERLGYRFEGLARDSLVYPDRREDRAVYARLVTDAPA